MAISACSITTHTWVLTSTLQCAEFHRLGFFFRFRRNTLRAPLGPTLDEDVTPHVPDTENTLLKLCTSFFSIVLWLRTHSEFGTPENLRHKILSLFAKMESEGVKTRIAPVNLHAAKFALAALIDEAIMNSPWPGKNDWEKHMLQDELFNTTNAGEEFFTKLEELRRAERRETELLEVFHWCLLLGFVGRQNDRETRDLLICELRQELGSTVFSLREELSPGCKPVEQATPVRQRSWLPAAIICAVCLVGSLLYFLILENRLGVQGETVKARFERIPAKSSTE
jgi:type VI secretion system protein ImpK